MSRDYKYYREMREIMGNPIIDNRRGRKDYHKPGRKHSGSKAKTKWERREIVAWDGEGANDDTGTHIYNLLANSNGDRLINKEGIGTIQALDFFLDHGSKKAINVIFGGSYDVNMFLRDLPKDKLKELWQNGDTFWRKYRIFYAPRKKLTIQRFHSKDRAKGTYDTFTLWDVLGYFQSSFVVACRKWLGDLPILDEIDSMKHQRSEFRPEALDDIIKYNKAECMLLVNLMESLFDALDNADIKLIRYDGAGSIAAALLRKNEVTNHKGDPNAEVLKWAQYAYSGGRIEATKVGNEERSIYRYDINSAYPAGCLTIPSYQDATWTFDKEWDGQDCSMVKVRWSYPIGSGDQPFYPLFYRTYNGSILYPADGTGIYWGAEVRNLLDYQDPKNFEILGACNVHLANDIKPFAYLDDMYQRRLLLKKAGNMAAEAFKLGMNSTYGKLAQQAGYRNGRIPTYHQLLWAGQITAYTRASLYRAAMQAPESVIAFATDAVITTSPLKLPISDQLGEWTADKFEGITIVQPGVYWLKDPGEDWGAKYRGFDKGSLHREEIVECWRKGIDYQAHLTRFVGMGSALMSTEFDKHWRTWESSPRTLTLTPSGKRHASEDVCYWDHLCATVALPNPQFDEISKPYPLLWDDSDDAMNFPSEDTEFQTLREQILDSYA